MFGKKGVFKNAERTKSVLKRILYAWITSQAKVVVGWLFKILLKVVKYIPVIGNIVAFLADFGEYLFAFITTQIMLEKQRAELQYNETAEQFAKSQTAQGASILK